MKKLFAALLALITVLSIAPTAFAAELLTVKDLNKNATVGSHADDDFTTASIEMSLRETVDLTSETTGQSRYTKVYYPRVKKIKDDLENRWAFYKKGIVQVELDVLDYNKGNLEIETHLKELFCDRDIMKFYSMELMKKSAENKYIWQRYCNIFRVIKTFMEHDDIQWPRTGARCSTGCIPAGLSAAALPTRSWTTRKATKPA